MKLLLVTDTHFTDREQDAYRWDVFTFLHDTANRERCEALLILGDLTDKRDNHSALLINQLIESFETILKQSPIQLIAILGGNHDKPFGGPAYFDFLSVLDNRVVYVSKPYRLALAGASGPLDVTNDVLMLPYTKDAKTDWASIDMFKSPVAAIFIHQAVEGAVAANGIKLESDCNVILPRGKAIFSGHIHKPQVCGPVTYVGAPYHVAFGDIYEPRVMVFDTETQQSKSIETKLTKKLVISYSTTSELEAKIGFVRDCDQVKLRYQAKSGEYDLRAVELDSRAVVSKVALLKNVVFEAQSIANLNENQPAYNSASELAPETVIRQYLDAKNQNDLLASALAILGGKADLDDEDRITFDSSGKLSVFPNRQT